MDQSEPKKMRYAHDFVNMTKEEHRRVLDYLMMEYLRRKHGEKKSTQN